VNTTPKLTVLISREQIADKVQQFAAQIDRDYAGQNLLLVGLLKGSFIFLSDLARALTIPVEIDFICLSSYGCGTESSGRVEIRQAMQAQVEGRHVLVVEDIVDSGVTLNFFIDYLKQKQPASVKICALTEKPSRRKIPVNIDYLGFTVPDVFLVGYGLDWAEKYRNLPDICTVEAL